MADASELVNTVGDSFCLVNLNHADFVQRPVKEPPWKLGEVAWLLLEVAESGRGAKLNGSCVGQISLADICLSGGKLSRLVWERGLNSRRARHNTRKHLQLGHDDGCRLWGVSLRALTKLCSEVAQKDHVDVLIYLLNSAVETSKLQLPLQLDTWDILFGEISTRITPSKRTDWAAVKYCFQTSLQYTKDGW